MNTTLIEATESSRSSASRSLSTTPLTDIFVAVHGIGEQNRNATTQAVATLLAQASVLGGCWSRPPVAPQPLGYFQGPNRSMASVSPIVINSPRPTGHAASIGLAEVYWADIPRGVVEEGRTLEETKAWACTVVARAQALCRQAREQEAAEKAKSELDDVGRRLQQTLSQWELVQTGPDFELAGEVLRQMIETIYVVENILFIARKTGVVSLDLTGMLNDFLGDVQLVTEFASHRLDVVGRFHGALERIYQEQKEAGNGEVRLHIVSHSEGTVVSFLGLLHALSGHRIQPSDTNGYGPRVDVAGKLPEWLSRVRSYLTLGSPIDKHLLLWKHLWTDIKPLEESAALRIRWRNYYDVGDPVGFRLDTARGWLAENGIKAFEFEEVHDIGFARYLVPGKAHVDYWTDRELFAHYLTTAAFSREPEPRENAERLRLDPTPAPPSKVWVQWLAPMLPYLVSFAILMLGVGLAGKTIADYILPVLSPSDNYAVRTDLGLIPPEWNLLTLQNVVGVSLLILGVTLLGRLPRLAAGFRWKVAGMEAFVLGALAYGTMVDYSVQREVGYLFSLRSVLFAVPLVFWLAVGCMGKGWAKVAVLGGLLSAAAAYRWIDWINPMTPENEYVVSLVGTWLLALTVALTGLAVTRRPGDRRKRWLLRGMRPLILGGALVVTAMVWREILPIPLEEIRSRKAVTFDVENDAGTPVVRQVRLSETVHSANRHRTQETRVEHQAEYDLWWELQALAPLVTPPTANGARPTADPAEAPRVLDDKLWRLAPVITAHPPLWTVAVATVGLLYLWWLSALLFDLSFVWHRYVRRAGVDKNLRRWGNFVKRSE